MAGSVEGGRTARRSPSPPDVQPTIETHPWLYVLGGPSKLPIISYYGGDVTPEALKRSWDLLLEHLDGYQRRDLLRCGHFTIHRPMGRKVVIHASLSQINVFGTTAVGRRTRYCTMSRTSMPFWDLILSQTLAVKYNWKWFHDTAVKM